MSLQGLKSAAETTAPSHAARLVMYALGYHHHAETGQCFPSITTLAERAQVAPRSVQRALVELIDAGLIAVDISPWTVAAPRPANRYHLHFLKPVDGAQAHDSVSPHDSVSMDSTSGGGDVESSPHDSVSKNHDVESSYRGSDREEEKGAATKAAPKAKPSKAKPPADPTPVNEAFRLFNEMAERVGIPAVKEKSEARREALKQRMNGRGLPRWIEALEAVESSQFLCGERPGRNGQKPFRVTFDWLVKAANFQKVIEGNYSADRRPERAPAAVSTSGPTSWPSTRWQSVVYKWSLQKMWPENAGPRPDQPGCLAPKNILALFERNR